MRGVLLSREGVFPVVVDAAGERCSEATGFGCAGTIQGEGKLAGVPSLFVRTQGCNLRCVWASAGGVVCGCDTSHTSFEAGDGRLMSCDDIWRTLERNLGNIGHVVITGGEPMLQAKRLLPLLRQMRQAGLHVTVETNGTIFDSEVVGLTSLLSISPKLRNSVPTAEKLARLGLSPNAATLAHAEIIGQYEALQRLVDCAKGTAMVDLQLKFVVASPDDEAEIARLCYEVLRGVEATDIVVMPMGTSASEIRKNGILATAMSIKNGWRFSPRLHIDLFGNREGV